MRHFDPLGELMHRLGVGIWWSSEGGPREVIVTGEGVRLRLDRKWLERWERTHPVFPELDLAQFIERGVAVARSRPDLVCR